MAPSQKGFGADQGAIGQTHLRLIMKFELLLLPRPA